MSYSLPENPNLEHLRKQAKDLLSSYRKGDSEALQRFSSLPKDATAKPMALHDAQLVVAREHGFASWPKLVAEVERLIAGRGITPEIVDSFVQAATSDGESTCRRLLELYPSLPRFNSLTALVCGEADLVRTTLEADANFATTPTGPKDWMPLEYCCYSRVFRVVPNTYQGLEDCVILLLNAGADPDSRHLWRGDEESPLSALYGAAGETGHVGIVRLLLEAGANPNDQESMYHSAQHNWREVLELLVKHGGDVNAAGSKWTNTPIFFLCGWRPTDAGYDDVLLGIEWLLDREADPNIICYPKKAAETALHCACRTNGTKLVDMLLAHGADPQIMRADGKTAYELAVLTGNGYAVDALVAVGAQVELTPDEAAFAAFANGDSKAMKQAKAWASDHVREATFALTKMAEFGNVEGVRALIELEVPVSTPGDDGATPLHYACFCGQTLVVQILLQHGANLEAEDNMYHGTPLGWALEAFGWHRRPEVDYRELFRLLLDAGASKEHLQKFVDEHAEDVSEVKEIVAPLLGSSV